MLSLIIIFVFLISVLYAHSRGKIKQKFSRQLFDHSTFMAPINMFSSCDSVVSVVIFCSENEKTTRQGGFSKVQ